MTLTHSEEASIKWAKENDMIMQDEAPCPECLRENRPKKGTLTYYTCKGQRRKGDLIAKCQVSWCWRHMSTHYVTFQRIIF